MATNNPAGDFYNQPGLNSRDFERVIFGDLEVDELFWQTDTETENNPWRKVNQNQAINLKSQTTHSFDNKTIIYQKI